MELLKGFLIIAGVLATGPVFAGHYDSDWGVAVVFDTPDVYVGYHDHARPAWRHDAWYVHDHRYPRHRPPYGHARGHHDRRHHRHDRNCGHPSRRDHRHFRHRHY